MRDESQTPHPSPTCIFWERISWTVVAVSGILLLVSALSIIFGSVYQPQGGILGIALSDPFALVWITIASFAHLSFVPAFCAGVALRDHRRKLAGIPIPPPRSIWSGHDSVFGDAWRREIQN